MSEPLLFTVCSDPAGLATTCTGGVLLVQVGIGWTCDHRAEIAESWTDGRKWLRTESAAARRTARALAMWLLVHLLRPHGKHRTGVAA
jgi:hypothetical protein